MSNVASSVVGAFASVVLVIGCASPERPATRAAAAERPAPHVQTDAVRGRAPLVPRSMFLAPDERDQVRLSPDGTQVSYVAPHRNRPHVWVQTIGAGDARPISPVAGRAGDGHRWAANGEQILVRVLTDEGTALRAADVDGGGTVTLAGPASARPRIVATDRRRADRILIAVNEGEPPARVLSLVDTRTGARERVESLPWTDATLTADEDLVVRVATRRRQDGSATVLTRDDANGAWYEFVRWAPDEAAASRVLGCGRGDGAIYLVDARGHGTSTLCVYTPPGSGEGSTYRTLARRNEADVTEVVLDPFSGKPQLVAFDGARRGWRAIDYRLAAEWERVGQAAGAEADVTLAGRDALDERWLISIVQGDAPRSYAVWDRKEALLLPLFAVRRAPERRVAHTRTVTLRARDGLTLHGIFTRPADGVGGPRPMVLHVHDGPWSRVRYGYHPVHQWLASRGYAVLSVNYRGSRGFGRAFVDAGDREWSGRMHDDLLDAVNWAVREGEADPDRVAIAGSGYGGYAALVGVAFTPAYFAAAIAVNAPVDVRTMLASVSRPSPRATFERRVGRPAEPAFLAQISPVSRLDAIRRPLLLVRGELERRVTDEECRQVVASLEANGVPITYVALPGAGRGLADGPAFAPTLALAEVFLARHLGGRAEPIGEDLEGAGATITGTRLDLDD